MRSVAAAVVLTILLSGCVELHRAEVDPDVVARAPSDFDWTVERSAVESEGMFGPKFTQTRYNFDPPSSAQPPYPGLLQVYSLAESDPRSDEELQELLMDQVDDAVAREGIALRPSLASDGERTIHNGEETLWFVRGGTVQEGDGFFSEDVEVRILGEVWHDAHSETSVIVVGLAQTAVERFLTGSQQDLRTWSLLVGDPAGTIDDRVHQNGFVYHVRSH